MRALLGRLDETAFDADGFSAVEESLTETYRRGRKAMRRALGSEKDSHRHEWRKQAKYHWYHVRLLRSVWKPAMEARGEELSRLSDLLGDDHDLAVLSETVSGAADLDPGSSDAVLTAVSRRRARLLAEARPLGERLYAEKPEAFANRMRRYWKVWRRE